MKIARISLLLSVLLTANAAAQSNDCIEFEGFEEGTTFTPGQTLIEAGVPMTIGSYTDGRETYFENAFISPFSPHQGQSLGFSTATVEMDIVCAEEVVLHFVNAGGGMNVGVNGELEIPESGNEVLEIGGVTVVISSSGSTGLIRFISAPVAIQSIVVGGAEFFIDNVCILRCGGNDNCFDFEEISGQVFESGDFFLENDRVMEIRDLPGQSGGQARASQENSAGHLGMELLLQSSTAFVDFGCASGVSLRAYQGAPGVFLAVNGASATTESLASFHNQSLGGVSIAVVNGVVTLTGEVGSFEIGGTSLAIDHLCVAPCFIGCIDFETQTPGAEFRKGDIIVEDGIVMVVDTFETDPRVVIENKEQRAGHLQQDAALFDATLTFGFPCAAEVSLHFGQYADGVTVGTSKDRVIVESMLELDGMKVGGAILSVTASEFRGALIGTLRAVGDISDFIIGGTEIVIDHVCHVPCPDPGCVDFEVFPLGQTFSRGDVFFEEETRITVAGYTGPMAPALVTIGNDNFTGGGGKEAILEDAQILIEFSCAERVEFSYSFVPGGLPGVRLGVNSGIGIQVNNFAMLDGDLMGGASIRVTGTSSLGRVEITRLGWADGITSVLIGGNNLAIDNICHTDCQDVPPVDPPQVGRAAIVSAAPINATQRRVIIEFEMEGTGTPVLLRSTTLGPGSNWMQQAATLTTPGGNPNLRRFTADIPLSEPRLFFRVRVDP